MGEMNSPKGMNLVKMSRLTLILAVLSYFSACGGIGGPSNFWSSYQPNLITASWSDQGPWGGIRWVQWSSKAPGVFGETQVSAFAKKKGWICSEPKPVSSDEVSGWVYMREPVFPLVFGKDDGHTRKLKRHIEGNAIVIQCDSGWTRIDAGNGESSKAYGYILLNSDRSKMAIYHYWGE